MHIFPHILCVFWLVSFTSASVDGGAAASVLVATVAAAAVYESGGVVFTF